MSGLYSQSALYFCIALILNINSPPKVKTIRIIENPFPDIIPRITAAEKRAQQKAREQAIREREEEIRRRGAKKYVSHNLPQS